MPPSFRLSALGLLAALICSGSPAFGQGLYSGIKGARVAGRAGAFVAKADDLYAIDYNPAGLAKLNGWVVQISDRLSSNNVIFDRAPAMYGKDQINFDRVSNETPLQALDPFLAVGTDFGLEDWGFALAIYAPPGSARMHFDPSTQLKEDLSKGAARYMMVGRDAEILNYTASAAYKFKDVFGLGLTAQYVHVPKLDYSLVVSPVLAGLSGKNAVRGPHDALSSVSGSDPFSMNLIVGGWVKPAPYLEAGLAATIPVTPQIVTSSHMTLQTVGASDYINLTRNGVPADDVKIIIPLPVILKSGLRYLHKKGEQTLWDIEFDFTYQFWSKVDNFMVSSNGLVGDQDGVEVPVGEVQIAKNWKNSFTLSLGGDVNLIPDKLTVRAGAGYESAVSDPAYQQVDFATGQHVNGALGGSIFFGKVELAASYGYRHMIPVTVGVGEGRVYQQAPPSEGFSLCPPPYDATNCPYPGQPSATVNEGKFQAFSHQVSVDGIFRF